MPSEAVSFTKRNRLAAAGEWVFAIAGVVWPLVPMALARTDAGMEAAPQVAAWLMLIAATVIATAAVHAFVRHGFATIVGIFIGVYATFCTLLSLYRLSMHDWLDIGFILAVPEDSIKTAYKSLGLGWTASSVVALLIHVGLYAAAFGYVARGVAALKAPVRHVLAVVALLAIFFIAAPHQALIFDARERATTVLIKPALPRVPYTVTSGESVFIVQLESLNGIAANGDYDVGDPNRLGAADVMRRLGKQGIYFPYVWSHDVQTHRAQQSILCGSVGNLHNESIFEQKVVDRPCMPKLFRDAGYRTVFLSSYTDPRFGQTAAIAKHSGFQDIHFSDYMRPGDPKALWGYEENAFFRRSFEYLRENYRPDERLLVFFVVTAHHVGFTRRRSDDAAWFVEERETQLAKYFDSARKQDASLQTLWNELMAFTNGNAHLLVTGDHSYPLGLYGSVVTNVGATVDNFLTSMLYVPPRHRAAEFELGKVVKQMPGHSDILPTVAELVSRKPQVNSLVPFMLRNPPAQYEYEPCQVMVQPFQSPAIAIARGESTFVYRFMSDCYQRYDIVFDPLRQQRGPKTCGVSFEEFVRRHGCKRYR